MSDDCTLDGVRLVVPCYNEAHRLDTAAYLEFTARHPELRLLFVDDGSTDATAAVLEQLRGGCPASISVMRLAENRGKAEAVRQGILRALESDARYVGFWDADLATPLDALCEFQRVLEGRPSIEMVIGSRVQLLGRSIERRRARHYIGRVFATVVSLMLDLRVYDTQCGAKLFRAGPDTRALFAEPFRTDWIFDVELFARLVRARRGTARPPAEQVVCEIPLTHWSDVGGSKLRRHDFVVAAIDLLRIARWMRRPNVDASRRG